MVVGDQCQEQREGLAAEDCSQPFVLLLPLFLITDR
jgi:hypothetical protein